MFDVRVSILVASAVVLSTAAGCGGDDGKPSSGTSGSTASLADAGEEASAEGGARKANAESCSKPEECTSNVCFVGATQSYCSLACTDANAPTTCAAPLTGS